jgi:hypothetical protein
VGNDGVNRIDAVSLSRHASHLMDIVGAHTDIVGLPGIGTRRPCGPRVRLGINRAVDSL